VLGGQSLSSREQLAEFIRSNFRSVWSLELLLLIKREPRPWTVAEIVAALRASELVVTNCIKSLTAAGLVAPDSDNSVSFRPASDELGRLADETEALYARQPDAVRRLIVASSSGFSLSDFANAFRWRDK
jgi:DNA-binding IclR family transcriptional regulator